MSEELARKYRPTSLNEFMGNDNLIESLRSVISREEGIPASILFRGPSGCGKTTLARIIANEMGIEKRNVKELNISDTGGVDAAREIINKASYAPLSGKKKIIILDETHQATKHFQNAMLKVLEEPPKNTHFILCTTEPEKLVSAIRNRCTTYEVNTLVKKDMVSLIKKVLKNEKVDEFPSEAIKEIVRISEGCPRVALKILDSVIDIEDDEKLIEAIQALQINERQVKELCQAIAKKAKWKEIANILKGIKDEPEAVRRMILGYFASALLSSGDVYFAHVISCFEDNYFDSGKAGLIVSCFNAIEI